MNRLYCLAIALALSLGWLGLAIAPALADAGPDDESRRWHQVLDTLAADGIERVESIEPSLTGRFDVDALGADGVEHDIRLSRDGSEVRSRRSQGEIDDTRDAHTLDRLRAILTWLHAQGYHDIQEISGDDGLAEVEARDARNRRAEITLHPDTLQIVELEFERLIELD